tara:strand:+ start:140557 stop:141477 length:921 start_codon:yes stop_codon:yes gene_type:complete
VQLTAIELRHLRYFIAVADAGTFRGAALQLHVSQPPLTRQIQQLEGVLEVKLFERKSRGVELTAPGEVLYEEANNILALVDQAALRTKQAGEGQLGRLDVGIFGSAIYGAVPTIIREFRATHPKVEIILHNLDRPGQIKALRERRLTAGLNRFFGDEPGLSWEKVHSERMNLAVYLDHPFANRSSITPSEVGHEPLILYPRKVRPSFIDYVQKMFHECGITPNIAHEVDDVTTAIALVSSGMGLSLVTQSASNLRLPNVGYIPLEHNANGEFDLDIIYRSDDSSPLLQTFLETVRALRSEIIPDPE